MLKLNNFIIIYLVYDVILLVNQKIYPYNYFR